MHTSSSSTPTIMIQGTSSNAGKSLLTAALCRIFARKGYKVAPFKAQNMTSFGYTLPCQGVISSAQVLQSIAAGIAPSVSMNPVLLCPSKKGGSEVFIMGKSKGHMGIKEYIQYKEQAFEAVKQAYDGLAAQSDIMIIEGAGSPAEINLQQHDIVNMRMAHHAKAKVLLVGDIDRGGVFAHLYGTFLLVPPQDQQRIAGFVLNKFRGDASLLAPATQEITQKTGIPFLATIPHVSNLHLPEEDSLSLAENVNISDQHIALDNSLLPSLDIVADAVEQSFGWETLMRLAKR